MDTSFWHSLRTRLAAWAAAVLLPFLSGARDKLRGVSVLLVGLVTLWLIATPNPLVPSGQELAADPHRVKVGLLAWLVCKESTLAYLGYWIDRLLHPRSRPGDLRDIERMAAEKRRAFIVCAAMLAGGLFQ
jgi:hypothetical protein